MNAMEHSQRKHFSLAFFIVAPLSLFFCHSAVASWSSYFEQVGQRMCMITLDCAHWYVAGNIGFSHLHDSATPHINSSVNENGPGWNVSGGYQFNSLLGAELGYTQYHDSRETFGAINIAKTEHYAVDLAATGRYPLFDKWSALAKLGIAYSYANKIFNIGPAFSASAVSVYWGLGATYSITPKVDFIAQFANVTGNNYTGSSGLFSLGASFAIV
jgi:hypothetical protein